MTLTLTYVVKIMILSESFSHRSLSIKKVINQKYFMDQIKFLLFRN